MSNNTTEKRDLVFTRIFNASAALVWQAWTDPKLIMQWWGPDRFTCPSAVVDFREGGVALFCMQAPKEFGGQDFYSIWKYTKIIALERIEVIHNLCDKDGNKVDPVTLGVSADFPADLRYVIAFNDLGDSRTELTVTEFGWPVGKMMQMAQMGMEQSLGKMERMLAGI